MRIVFNTSFEESIRSVNRAAESMHEAQRQVASGKRMSTPSDDPLGAVAAVNEHDALSRLGAYASAADAAAYRLGLVDSALSDVLTQLTAAQSATVSARGSSRTQADRNAASQQILAIRDSLQADINTKFQNAYLFSGSRVDRPAYATTAPNTFSAYQGDVDATRIEVEPGRSVASTFDGAAIFQGGDPAHILDALTTLATAITNNDDAAIQVGVDAIGRAFDRATAAQSAVGNDLRVIDDGRIRTAASKVGVIARLTTVEDADLAQAASQLAQSETSYRAALASAATLGRVSLMDYLK